MTRPTRKRKPAQKTIKRRASWPKWAKWVAKDGKKSGGNHIAYSIQPVIWERHQMWCNTTPFNPDFESEEIKPIPIPGPWRYSLRKIVS